MTEPSGDWADDLSNQEVLERFESLPPVEEPAGPPPITEEMVVLELLSGMSPTCLMLEVGPGGNPTPWRGPYLSVDRTAPGMVGEHGSEAGVVCTAKYKAEMHDLPFQRSQFDILVARHVLEHDPDTLTVLNEWHRVLRPGGVLVVICPDQQDYAWNTIHLDPTHRACFTRNQLAALARHAGFEGIGVGAALPQWSFFLLARKPGPASWEDVMTNFYKYQIKS